MSDVADLRLEALFVGGPRNGRRLVGRPVCHCCGQPVSTVVVRSIDSGVLGVYSADRGWLYADREGAMTLHYEWEAKS